MKILIIGAGVAGLSLAGFLEKLDENLEYQIIEKRGAGEVSTGYALALLPLGLRVLDKLSLLDSAIDNSKKLLDYKIYDKAGKLIGGKDNLNSQGKYGVGIAITRETLIKILMNKVERKKIIYGKKYSDLGEDYLGDFDLIIGADGVHSQVRNQNFPENSYQKKNLNLKSWSFKLEKNDIEDFKFPSVLEVRDKKFFVGVYNVKGSSPMGLINTNSNMDLADILNEVDLSFLPQKLDSYQNLYEFDQYEVKMSNWRNGNYILIGDAAHAFSPASGMGASQSLLDSFYLFSLIRENISRGESLQQMYNKFDQKVGNERLPMLNKIRERSHLRLKNQDIKFY
jgi:2-polyprenyl-6-methoxyphenol hydroxylase-like FAD-dependent oxidoreductase